MQGTAVVGVSRQVVRCCIIKHFGFKFKTGDRASDNCAAIGWCMHNYKNWAENQLQWLWCSDESSVDCSLKRPPQWNICFYLTPSRASSSVAPTLHVLLHHVHGSSSWSSYVLLLLFLNPLSNGVKNQHLKFFVEIAMRMQRGGQERGVKHDQGCHVLSCSLANGVVKVVKTNVIMKAQQILIHHISPFGKHLIGSGFILAQWQSQTHVCTV